MRKIIAGLLALSAAWIAPNAAVAQSACSYIASGAVLTAAQWNGCFQAKADLAGSAAQYLPLAGGTMTGPLIVDSIAAIGGLLPAVTTPALLTVGSGAAGTAYPAGSDAIIQSSSAGVSGTGGRMALDGLNAHYVISFRYFNGTYASPTAVLSGTEMGAIGAFGYGATTINSGHSSDGTDIGFFACQTWTDTNQCAYADIEATPLNTPASSRIQVATFNATSTAAANITIGVPGSVVGSLILGNATSGTLSIAPPTGALASAVLTAPDVTDTLAVLNTAQTWGAGQTLNVNQNGGTTWLFINNNAGASADVATAFQNGTGGASFGLGGTGYSLNPLFANRGFVGSTSGSAGIVINNSGANPILFATSNTERARITPNGGFALGSTTDPGATNALIAGTLQIATLPTSAGSGGLNVCVDTSGNLYKKSSCP